MISFKSHGSLTTLGPVHIGKLATNPREHDMGEPIITYPVTIEARNVNGGKEELRFGQPDSSSHGFYYDKVCL